MSASPHNAYCDRCEAHVDNCDCICCESCGITLARWFEQVDDGRCSKCREKRYVVAYGFAWRERREFDDWGDALRFYRDTPHASIFKLDHCGEGGLTENEQLEMVG